MKKEITKTEKTKKSKKKKLSKLDKQFYKLLIAMAAAIVVFFISYYFFQSLRTFEYQGLTFTKDKFGEIPIYRYYYYFSTTGSAVKEDNPQRFDIILRVDPRENNVTFEGDEIIFPSRGKFIYLSVNNTGLQCTYSNVALFNIAQFLTGNGYTVKPATPDKNESENTQNLRYATCETHPDNMVLLIREGAETKIVKQNNCYTISVANCEILPAVEKFMVQSIIDGKNRYEISN
ncbi:hypothetical protein HYV50_01970 [Candidatus Pacearchaeota archaeon]|nr:hypothetical protein [Candidatus Pacearchaeota archaeon]